MALGSCHRKRIFLVGICIVAAAAILSYAPALKMQFRPVDDYTLVAWAAQMSLPEYLAHALDPRAQSNFYRPVLRFLILIEHAWFGTDARFYHFMQVLLHTANAVLLALVVQRATTRPRVALIAGIFFAAFPTASETVFWISDAAPLATLFMLSSLWFWISHLQSQRRVAYWLAVALMVLAFLSKEISIALPAVLFLIDRMLIRDDPPLAAIVRRYLPIGVLTIAYVALEISVQSRSIYLNEASYTLGDHVGLNYINYFAMLALPWGISAPYNYAAVWVVGMAILVAAILRRRLAPLFLIALAFLTVGPVVLSPQGAYARYLYLATIPWAIAWGLALDARGRVVNILAPVLALAVLMANSFAVADAAANFSEHAIRRVRVPYRDIMRAHPTIGQDTLLFLIEPPYIPITDAQGMFYFQYGDAVTVRGTYADGAIYVGGRLPSQRANLREHANAFVYYFDETLKAQPIRVDSVAETHARPGLPRDFSVPIRLEGYEITSTTLTRGAPFALILYWRATGPIEKDYTVFAHLVHPNGDIIAGEDTAPRGGKERTSKWRANQFTPDGRVLIVPSDAPLGNNYRLEVGLYDQPTGERVGMVDANGAVIADQIVIETLSVGE